MPGGSILSEARPPHPDPAERRGYLRYFYRDWRPTRLARIWNTAYAWIARFGLLPPLLVTLQVTDRATGHLRSNILVAATHQGQRYLVSMLGNGSEWVRNLRAGGGRAFIKRGKARPVVLVELPPAERAPILKAWCQVATSGRQHLPVPHDAPVAAFAAIADAYPVFRIDPAPEPDAPAATGGGASREGAFHPIGPGARGTGGSRPTKVGAKSRPPGGGRERPGADAPGGGAAGDSHRSEFALARVAFDLIHSPPTIILRRRRPSTSVKAEDLATPHEIPACAGMTACDAPALSEVDML